MSHVPYLVATSPFEPADPPADLARFDPTCVVSAAFLDRLQRLDEATYGPRRMTLPRWAFYDCAELPGAIVGLARPDAGGPVPVTMFLATPMVAPGDWLGYSVCADGEEAGGTTEIAVETVELARRVLGARRTTSLTQWTSPKLRVWARFAPLEIRSAWTPAHSEPATCVLRSTTDGDDVPRADAELDVSSPSALRALQAEIEAGTVAFLLGPPSEGGRVPIARRSP